MNFQNTEKSPDPMDPGSRSDIKSRVHMVYILSVQPLPEQLAGFAKALEMNDFPFPQELDHIVHIRIIAEPENIVISDSGFLLWERIA